MTWAQRLKRVFGIDIETCRECGGAMKVMPKALAAQYDAWRTDFK